MSKELKKLIGEDVKKVIVDKDEYIITPLNLKKVGPASEALDSILGDLGKATWVSLFSKHGDKLVEFISAASEIDAEVLRTCKMKELIDVCDAVLELNIDFFLSLKEKIQKWTEVFRGQKSSNSSLRKVTTTKT